VRVLSVVGARPNFMKLAPVARALAARAVEHVIVHTGQHYDAGMSEAFFHDLRIPTPDHNLNVRSGSHARQTAAMMERLEPLVLEEQPDTVLVYGDVNSTVAAALVVAKLGIRLGHVEAGLRSRDWSMPEEINRVVTDRLADLLFTPSRDADENLLAEGVAAERIKFVGNVMIDSLVHALDGASGIAGKEAPESFVLVTLHRPGNVDDPEKLAGLVAALDEVAAEVPVLFPAHPRTRDRMEQSGLRFESDVRLMDPVGYVEMLGLVSRARLVLTDSGGIQEETTFLGVPCLTVRPTTERPITVSHGTNRLVDAGRDAVTRAVRERLAERRAPPPALELWDGHASTRIVDALLAP
jgi:UDP-N-acetylglucosamine 2-epimerase (non-hydrolysing)